MVLGIMRSKKFSKRVLGVLLVIIIPAFVFWGVGSLSDRPKPAGKIFGRSISAEDFRSSRQGVQVQIMLNFFSDYDRMSSILKDRTLINTMAWERLLLLMSARAKKLDVPNRDVMLFIASHPLFQRGGSFDKAIYGSVLRNPALSISPRQFEELVRENLLVIKFRDMLLGDITVTDEEITEIFLTHAGKAAFSYFLIDKETYSGGIDVTDLEVKEAYERNKDRLYSQEKAKVEYIEAPYSSIDEKTLISSKLENELAGKSAENISLKDIAGKMGMKYGESPLFAREDTLVGMEWFQGFNDTSFSLKNNEISYPVSLDSEKGSVFVIKRLETETPRLLSFEDVSSEIALALKNVKSVDLAKTKANELFEAISKGDLSFEDAAASIEAGIEQTPLLSIEDRISDIAPARELVISALSLSKDELLSPYITPKGVLILRVDETQEAPLSDLTEDVKDALRNRITTEKQNETISNWLKQHSADIETYRPLEEM